MEFEEISKASNAFAILDEAFRHVYVAEAAAIEAKGKVRSGYSEAVQQRLVEINPDKLTDAELNELKLGIFKEIEDTTRTLTEMFPSGNINVGSCAFFLNDDGATRRGDEVIISLSYCSNLPDQYHDFDRISTGISREGNRIDYSSIGELLDLQESLDGILAATDQTD